MIYPPSADSNVANRKLMDNTHNFALTTIFNLVNMPMIASFAKNRPILPPQPHFRQKTVSRAKK